MALAAIYSAARILDQVLQHQHFNVENREEVESLFNEMISLQAILENSNNNSTHKLNSEEIESEMVDAANKVRDLVETHIGEHVIRRNNLILSSCKLLEEARREIGVILVQELGEIDVAVLPEQKIHSLAVEIDENDVTAIAMQLLISGRQTVFVVGMAGIGKTAVARQIFNHYQYVMPNIRAWVDISQSYYYDVKQILIDILHSLGEEMHQETTQQQLEQRLYRRLENKAYFIVLDDLRDIQVFDYLTKILPDDDTTRRRILVTTRLENVALSAKSSYIYIYHMTIHDQNLHRQVLFRNIGIEAEALLEVVSFLHDFIRENSSGKSTQERKSLENQITNVEKRVKGFTQSCFMEYNLTFSTQCLAEVKEEIDLVKKLITKIDKEVEEAQNLHCLLSASSSKYAATVSNIIVEDFKEIKSKLVEGSSRLEIVCLAGMGGIGKTTLAKQVYDDKLFTRSFPIRAWVTVSQSYDRKKVLKGLLDSMEKDSVKVDKMSTARDLSERLYKRLKGWKYLIVIDDVWDTKVWDDLKRIFPDDKCSSRIILTTRLKDVAIHANSCLHQVRFLTEGESWNLFCSKVFGEDSCPPQLKEIGKKIVKNCRGLPLSIVVIGGLLSRVTKTQEYWENISQNLSSIVLLNGNHHCLQILSLSYAHLSAYMKKCFLYIGIFPEDSSILISKLVKLWVAEGFLEPLNSNRLMEDIAYETVSDLVGRSLLLIVKHSSTGKIKNCKIHDLVRDFCILEAEREIFFHITDMSLYGTPLDAKIPLCLSIHPNDRNIMPCDRKKLSSLQVSSLHIFDMIFQDSMHHLNGEPLIVLDLGYQDRYCIQRKPNEILSRDLRYFSFNFSEEDLNPVLSSSGLPELQTLILHRSLSQDFIESANIWNMAQLRHVKVSRLCLLDLVEGGYTVIVLTNLQTLSQVYNFRWTNEVLERIPNLKKLGILYELEETDGQHYYLENLSCLQKLEALTCTLSKPCPSLLHILRFPPSLRKLTLKGCSLPWKEMKIVGSLPNLEVLKLRESSFAGKEWELESIEDEFPKLKYLLLERLDIELWTADSVNFLSLQHLIIEGCYNLKEIPHCIGEIPTLELMDLFSCANSLIDSVKEMLEEQVEAGYDGFQVRIQPY